MITDLTRGKPNQLLWRYLLPMMLSVMFQQCYNLADSMIAGRFAGEDALAAIGASYPITVIFMAFGVGSSLGASVIVSRFFGARDYRNLRESVRTALISAVLLGIFMTVFGYFFCSGMLRLISTPENVFSDAALYLRIYIYGIVFLLLYNVCTGIFTALGDSKTPLYFLIASSVGNIVLDYVFVAYCGFGVAGVAWATFLAQSVSALLAFLTLKTRLKQFQESRIGDQRDARFRMELFLMIAAIAVPSILQQSVLSVGNLFIQDIVNGFGSSVMAGYSAAIKLNTFAINTFMTLGSCLSGYTAQNLGAGKPERIPLGFRTGLRLSFCTAFPFVLLYFGLSRMMIGMFLPPESTEAISSGTAFLKIVSPWYFLIVIKLMTDGIIRGSGAMTYFVIATIPDLVLRIVLSWLFSAPFGMGSTGIWLSWPFGWIATSVLTLIFYRRILTENSTKNISSSHHN